MEKLTHKRLLELLRYEENTGHFYWLNDRVKARAGALADTPSNTGYVRVWVDGKHYLAHRLAWFYVHEVWPEFIDHKNGVRTDNRLENLRSCSKSENMQNLGKLNANTSGYTGVCWSKQNQGWLSRIRSNGVVHYLGTFDDIEDAAKAYTAAKEKLHTFNPKVRK